MDEQETTEDVAKSDTPDPPDTIPAEPTTDDSAKPTDATTHAGEN